MKAATHTEVYRPFKGELRQRPFRAGTLAWSGIRIGFRKKLPALLLFMVPTIQTIVSCFIVNLKFEAESGEALRQMGIESTGQAQVMGALLADQLGQVEEIILTLLGTISLFVVLAMGWYGSGLIAEDKRVRAHLLYFARPMTRMTYFLGKLGTACFWGLCAVAVPITLVCSVASFASPDWAFLTDRWDVILKLEAYALLYVLIHGLLVLAISSVCDRRNHALGGLFGFYLLTSFGGEAMARLFDGTGWRLFSIPRNFERISAAMFDSPIGDVDWPLESTLWALGFLVAACVWILQRQTRKMETGS